MWFILLTVFSVAAVLAGITFHRYWTTQAGAGTNILYAKVVKGYAAWLVRGTVGAARRASPGTWTAFLKALPLWRLPVLERWLFLGLYGSFLYLAASGFFFALFVPRGLFGFPLVAHVGAGGIFAASLTLAVLLKGKDFANVTGPLELSLDFFKRRRLGITAAGVRSAAFWAFALAGFLLTLSALTPMLPLLRYGGQKLMLETHRLSALASLLAAMVFVGLELYGAGRRSS